MPIDEPAAAERKDLDRRRAAAPGDADHVDRADGALVGRLALRQVPDGREAVAIAGGLLELLALGRIAHLLLQLAQNRARVSGEELDHALHDLAVVLLRHVADARSQTAVDVVVEARDPRVAARLRPLARPVREDAVEDVQRLPHLLRGGIRAEVGDPAPVPLPRKHDPRVLVLHGHGDVGIALVVAEANVERRPVPLDQVLLQVERLHLGRGDDHLDLLDALEQPVEPEPAVPAAKVRAHAGPEGLGLADVEHGALGVAEEVDARLRREPLQLRLDALLAGGCHRRRHVRVSLAGHPRYLGTSTLGQHAVKDRRHSPEDDHAADGQHRDDRHRHNPRASVVTDSDG